MKGSREEIYNLKRDFAILGWESLKAWAEAFGFNDVTVWKAVNRHWGNPESEPRGEITTRIISCLEMTLKHGIRPDEVGIFFSDFIINKEA